MICKIPIQILVFITMLAKWAWVTCEYSNTWVRLKKVILSAMTQKSGIPELLTHTPPQSPSPPPSPTTTLTVLSPDGWAVLAFQLWVLERRKEDPAKRKMKLEWKKEWKSKPIIRKPGTGFLDIFQIKWRGNRAKRIHHAKNKSSTSVFLLSLLGYLNLSWLYYQWKALCSCCCRCIMKFASITLSMAFSFSSWSILFAI